MSHFSAFVSVPEGKNLEEVMLPYHEYESTGIEKYIQFVPCDKDELMKVFAEYGNGRDLDTFAHDWGGYRKDSAGVYGRFTNPNSRWDWYEVGGRWHGHYGIDSATKANFHFDVVRAARLAEFTGNHSAWNTARADILERIAEGEELITEARLAKANVWFKRYDKAKEYYNGNATEEVIDSLAWDALDNHWYGLDETIEMHLPADEYAKTKEWRALAGAFIDLEGKWHERGKMSWFGMNADENAQTYDGEHGEFWSFIASLPDDTMLYVVDCHI